MTPKQRAALRLKFGGRCAYCGEELPDKGWHADHVESLLRISRWQKTTADGPGRFVQTGKCYRPENDRPDNLVPACRACNISKGAESLEDWRKWLDKGIAERLRRDLSCFRHAERFGRVTIQTTPVVFWFEQYVRISFTERITHNGTK